jgi:hypothetical protein
MKCVAFWSSASHVQSSSPTSEERTRQGVKKKGQRIVFFFFQRKSMKRVFLFFYSHTYSYTPQLRMHSFNSLTSNVKVQWDESASLSESRQVESRRERNRISPSSSSSFFSRSPNTGGFMYWLALDKRVGHRCGHAVYIQFDILLSLPPSSVVATCMFRCWEGEWMNLDVLLTCSSGCVSFEDQLGPPPLYTFRSFRFLVDGQ